MDGSPGKPHGIRAFITGWVGLRAAGRRGVAGLLLAGVLPVTAAAQGGTTVTPALVFDKVTVIDVATGKLHPNQRVVIEGTRIKAVGGVSAVAIPRGAQVVEAKGKYLTPGFWDMHVHTGTVVSEAVGVRVPGTQGTIAITPELQHKLFIANGVTGIRDAWSLVPLDTLIRWRRESLAGTRISPPRQLLAGVAIDDNGMCVRGDNELTGHVCVSTADSADIEKLVQSLKAAGADFLKTYNLGEKTYLMVASAARRAGLRFGGHAPKVSPFDAADSGTSIIDHIGSPNIGILDSLCFAPATATVATCRAVAERFKQTNTWSVPTLSRLSVRWFRKASPKVIPNLLVKTLADFWGGAPLNRAWLANHEPLRTTAAPDTLDAHVLEIPSKVWVKVGLPILSGGDTGIEEAGFMTHAEMAIMVDWGVTPLGALQAATINPAKMLRATDSLGTVAAGKLADLVLLDANPLVDITNTTLIRAVVANGRYFDRAALDALLAEIRAKAQRPA